MLFNTISSTVFFLSFVILVADVSSVSAGSHILVPRNRHHQLQSRMTSGELLDNRSEQKLKKRKSCRRPRTTTPASPTKTTTTLAPSPSKPTSNGSGGANVNANAAKPKDWPTETQAGAAPAARRTSPADPHLLELSKSYNNKDNKFYNEVHRGEITYYGQGLGACGDTYDDNSFTAAVSKLMFDSWPGAWAGEMNRNPICGPFVKGRKAINAQGKFQTVVEGDGKSFILLGGDGLPNCAVSVTSEHIQCHIPLTATVKRGDKEIVVKIVDRCEGCAVGDIDLTPAAFKALADPALGRADAEWFFNKY